MNKKEIVSAIRAYMADNGLDACIIPSTDPHMGEYIPSHWATREWVSGFTGSAGTVVITMDFAGLWTDSRYFLQAEEQLMNSGIELVKLVIPHTPEYLKWLANNLKKGNKVAIDGNVISISMKRQIESSLKTAGIILDSNIDIPSKVWKNRPALPKTLVFDHEVKYAGESRVAKIERIREIMAQEKSDYLLVCTLDEIAWLFNLRGADVQFNPVFVSYALITKKEAILFTDPDKIPCLLMNNMQEQDISFMAYNDIGLVLSTLADNTSILLDPSKTNSRLLAYIPEYCNIKEDLGLVTQLKSIKNSVEIEGLKKVMVKDGIAWVKFLHWLDINVGKITITELSAAQKLESYRAEQNLYQGASFHPISSFSYHGAIVHYSVDENSSIELKADSIYLCDTGGHYLDGTTDTTRTVTLGNVTEQQKSDFTLALKGTMGVSMLRFPKGTKGYQMDILARKALWDFGLNYGHGTGHGVGFFLNVHEGPQTIGSGASGHMSTSMQPGMVTTVEPAIYRDGQYGMRTENVTLVIEDIENEYGTFYRFETLTLAPIDLKLINPKLLSPKEKEWLNSYHQEVFKKLRSGLNDEELSWLKENTRAI